MSTVQQQEPVFVPFEAVHPPEIPEAGTMLDFDSVAKPDPNVQHTLGWKRADEYLQEQDEQGTGLGYDFTWSEYALEKMPVAGSHKKGRDHYLAWDASKRIKAGEAGQDDYNEITRYLSRRKDEGDRTWTERTGDLIASLPAYAAEFYATGGAYTAGRIGGERLATKVLGEVAEKAVGKAVAATATRAAGIGGGILGFTAANPQLASERVASRFVPPMATQETDAGYNEVFIGENDESAFESVALGTLDAATELASEKAGAFITRIPALKKFKGAIAKAFFGEGSGKGALTARKMADVLNRAGYQGPIEEMGEERLKEIADGLTGVQDDFGTIGKLAVNPLDPDALSQLGSELTAFSIPGAPGAAVRLKEGRDRAARLAELKEHRKNRPVVSAEEGKRLGIDGTTRKERKKNRNAEIQQLETETQDAGTIREDKGSVVSEGTTVGNGRETGPVNLPEQGTDERGEAAAVEGTSEQVAPEVQEEKSDFAEEHAEAERQNLNKRTKRRGKKDAIETQDAHLNAVSESMQTLGLEGKVTPEQITEAHKEAMDSAETNAEKVKINRANEILQTSPAGIELVNRRQAPTQPQAAPVVSKPKETPKPPETQQEAVQEATVPKKRNGKKAKTEETTTVTKWDDIRTEGKRAVVGYHGTTADFDEFSDSSIGSSTGDGWLGVGFYFSPHEDVAKAYGSKTKKATVRLDNPYMFPEDVNPIKFVQEKGGPQAFTEWVKEQGHDGIISDRTLHQIIVFDTSQIEIIKPPKPKRKGKKAKPEEKVEKQPHEMTKAEFDRKIYRRNTRKPGTSDGDLGYSFWQDTETMSDVDSELRDYGENKWMLRHNPNEIVLARDLIEPVKEKLLEQYNEGELPEGLRDLVERQQESPEEAIELLADGMAVGSIVDSGETFDNSDFMQWLWDNYEDILTEKDIVTDDGLISFRQEIGEKHVGHAAAVEQAIADGKPVPPEVLAEYPDLVPPKPKRNGKKAKTEEKAPEKKPIKEKAEEARKKLSGTMEELRKHLKGKVFSGVDPELLALTAKLVKESVEAGVLTLAEFVSNIRTDLKGAGLSDKAVDAAAEAAEVSWNEHSKQPHPEETAEEVILPNEDDLTSIKKDVVNDLRKMVGLPEMEGSTPQTVEQWVESARATLAEDPKAAVRLVNELTVKPRPINQQDAMLLQFRYRQLANDLEPAVDEFIEATKTEDPVAIATARTAVMFARKAMTDFEEVIHPSKETWGRTGVALRQMMRKDFSIEAILRRGQEANNGESLSPKQTTELTKLAKEYKDLQDRFDKQQRKTEDLERELASKKQHKDVVKTTKRPRIRKKSEKRQSAEKRVADAWSKFGKAARGQANVGIPVNLLPPAVEIAKAYIELGTVRVGEFMESVRKNTKNPDEALFRKAWKQAVDESGVEIPELDMADFEGLTKETRRLQKQLIESGMTDQKQVVDTIHEILSEELPELTRSQTEDALSQRGLFQKSREESLQKQIEKHQATLDKGDFAPKPKKETRPLSKEELKLKREMEDVRHKVLRKYAEYHLANLHGIAWTADKAAEMAHLSRAMMTSFDLSALLRQGGLPAMGHPILAKRALVGTIASIASTFDKSTAFNTKDFKWSEVEKFLTGVDSKQAEFDLMHSLTSGTDGEFRLRSGLSLPGTDEAITRQEEVFQGRWGQLVPGVAVSSRLYTMILNKMRADLFDQMVQNLGRNGQVTIDEAKIIANFVNVATGRSDFGKKGNEWASVLNTVFFAPRYVASRFQYLAMPFYLPFKGGVKANWRVKRAIYKEYGRSAAGIGTVLGTIALAAQLFWGDDDEDKPTIETDARSSDFLKVKVGETRLDFMAGLSQAIVLSARMAPGFLGGGRTKSSVTGKVRDLGGEGFASETRLTVLARAVRTKFAPVPGAISTIADDWTNVVGQKETVGSLAGSLVTPLSLTDAAETLKAQGFTKGSAMTLLSILGVGMNTYGPKTEYTTSNASERAEIVEKDLENMAWDSPEQPPYSEFLTEEQLKEWSEKRQDKRNKVFFDATYDPSAGSIKSVKAFNKAHEKLAKDKEILKSMRAEGVSHEDAQQSLNDFYDQQIASGKRKTDKGWSIRSKALAELYGEDWGAWKKKKKK